MRAREREKEISHVLSIDDLKFMIVEEEQKIEEIDKKLLDTERQIASLNSMFLIKTCKDGIDELKLFKRIAETNIRRINARIKHIEECRNLIMK